MELATRWEARCESGRRDRRGGRRPSATAKTAPCGPGPPGLAGSMTRARLRTEGIAEQFRQRPGVKAEVDDGCRGLANEFPEQVSAPPRKRKRHGDDAPLTEQHGWREMKRHQSSRRICVEHANAEHRQWRSLRRYTGRRETYAEPPGHRRTRRRPRRPQPHSPQGEHRTRTRPRDGLLNHPPAEPPDQHAPRSIAGQPVRTRIQLGRRRAEAGQCLVFPPGQGAHRRRCSQPTRS